MSSGFWPEFPTKCSIIFTFVTQFPAFVVYCLRIHQQEAVPRRNSFPTKNFPRSKSANWTRRSAALGARKTRSPGHRKTAELTTEKGRRAGRRTFRRCALCFLFFRKKEQASACSFKTRSPGHRKTAELTTEKGRRAGRRTFRRCALCFLFFRKKEQASACSLAFSNRSCPLRHQQTGDGPDELVKQDVDGGQQLGVA